MDHAPTPQPHAFELDSYAFELPAGSIAQSPSPDREQSRLMVMDRGERALLHTRFAELVAMLRGDEVLVVNDTRVVKARLRGTKESGGQVELLVLPPAAGDRPDARTCMSRASKPLRPGARVQLSTGATVTIAEALGGGRVRVDFSAAGPPDEVMEANGEVPLPPYIHRGSDGPADVDEQRYQTVYARERGAVAAPTAGLHFTPQVLAALSERGIPVLRVTLHVGPGTFEPVRVSDLRDHRVEAEHAEVSEETAERLAEARREGRTVVAVGTTSVRTLEGFADEQGHVHAGRRAVDLTIRPGYAFRAVESLITNFHLPRSSLLVLVSAFAGRERVLSAYAEAVARGYRFYSYGDAMWIR